MKKVYIQDFNYISPLGANAQTNWDALLAYQSGIKKQQPLGNLEAYYASVIADDLLHQELEAIDVSHWPRIFKMAVAVLQPIIEKHRVNPESTLIISTTKGDIRALEQDNLDEASIPFLAEQLASYFGFRKRPVIVSNACVSGVLALAIAKRMIATGVMHEVYVLALDEVTEFVISGFNSFQAMSMDVCKPYDVNRKGVNLGEAAAAAFVTAGEPTENSIEIIGDGSINDANHISGPSRTGEGLFQSIQSALAEAQINSSEIDYISSHGTATIYNDEMEAIAFNRLHLQQTPVSSLKGYFGHTLGASGLLETLVTCQMMQNNVALANLGLETLGVSQPIHVLQSHQPQKINYALKTASGFGGSNTALLLKKVVL
ncbi:beta-ketoacyl synthase [Flavobacterium agricola]|uniref:Beta-ketoacyl synthase n=1 Tax=Flavobacterium agricola TaxID=2870839 RepID=A0ABY6M1K1_9FLAO|nr:beta-ketoacyl synthase N-terminal-like domain-containing protein [Flavobacterium agricola]UYW00996.1 beta-ketoacyl synthase [Flavobacterium agricola]